MPFVCRRTLICMLLITLSSAGFTQSTQQTAWLSWTHQQVLSPKFALHFDVLTRTADNLEYLRFFGLRPGLTYLIDKKQSITAGYTHRWTNDIHQPEKNITENWIWEQYSLKTNFTRFSLAHRLRIEQRFSSPANQATFFSQRLRYLGRFVIPLSQRPPFKKGCFAALQNETFLFVQHKEKLNGHLFDQNRSYAGVGFRFNQHLDAELGYMYIIAKTRLSSTQTHTGQLSVVTKF